MPVARTARVACGSRGEEPAASRGEAVHGTTAEERAHPRFVTEGVGFPLAVLRALKKDFPSEGVHACKLGVVVD